MALWVSLLWLGDHGGLVNYLIVTSLMTGTLVLINQLVKCKHTNRQIKTWICYHKETLWIIFLQLNRLHRLLSLLLWYGAIILFLVLSIYSSLAYHENPTFVKLFKGIQIVQLLALYTWYIGFGIPFSNSLPLLPLRLAMFAVVFLPDKWKIKQYFALLGASGAVFALGYPVFRPLWFSAYYQFFFPDWPLCPLGQFPGLSHESLR